MPQNLVVIPPFQDTKKAPITPESRFTDFSTNFTVILGFQNPAPVLFMVIKPGRDSDDVCTDFIHFIGYLTQVGFAVIRLHIVNSDITPVSQNIDVAVPKVKIDIKEIGCLNLFLPFQNLQGNSHVVKIAKSP